VRWDSGKVTHMVANTLPSAKIKNILALKGNIFHKPIVSPKWILDSIAKEKLQPPATYLLKRLAPGNTVSSMFSKRGKTDTSSPKPLVVIESENDRSKSHTRQNEETNAPISSNSTFLALNKPTTEPSRELSSSSLRTAIQNNTVNKTREIVSLSNRLDPSNDSVPTESLASSTGYVCNKNNTASHDSRKDTTETPRALSKKIKNMVNRSEKLPTPKSLFPTVESFTKISYSTSTSSPKPPSVLSFTPTKRKHAPLFLSGAPNWAPILQEMGIGVAPKQSPLGSHRNSRQIPTSPSEKSSSQVGITTPKDSKSSSKTSMSFATLRSKSQIELSESQNMSQSSLSPINVGMQIPFTNTSRHRRLYEKHSISQFIRFEDSPLYVLRKGKHVPSPLCQTSIYVKVTVQSKDTLSKETQDLFRNILLAFSPVIRVVGRLEAFLVFQSRGGGILPSAVKIIEKKIKHNFNVDVIKFGMGNSDVLAYAAATFSSEKSALLFPKTKLLYLPLSTFPHIGPTLLHKLANKGIKTCGDVISFDSLLKTSVSTAERDLVIALANGRDPKPSIIASDLKSSMKIFETFAQNLESVLSHRKKSIDVVVPVKRGKNEVKIGDMEEIKILPVEKQNEKVEKKGKEKEKDIPEEKNVAQIAENNKSKEKTIVSKLANWRLPQFHELNRDVVRELPEDIRKELAAAYKHRHHAKKPETESSPKPGKKSSPFSKSSSSKTRWKAPSYTDIDEETFRALPLEIQREIEMQKKNAIRNEKTRSKKPLLQRWLAKSKKKRREIISSPDSNRGNSNDNTDGISKQKIQPPFPIRSKNNIKSVFKAAKKRRTEGQKMKSDKDKAKSLDKSNSENNSKQPQNRPVNLVDIDPNTFKELPADIRWEILSALNAEKKSTEAKNDVKMANEIKNNKPSSPILLADEREVISIDDDDNSLTDKANSFTSQYESGKESTVTTIRSSLVTLFTSRSPVQAFVELRQHLVKCIQDSDLGHVRIVLRMLTRSIDVGNEFSLEAYEGSPHSFKDLLQKLIDQVQDCVRSLYDAELSF